MLDTLPGEASRPVALVEQRCHRLLPYQGGKSGHLCPHPQVLSFGLSRRSLATFPAKVRPTAASQKAPIGAAAVPGARDPAPRTKLY